MISYEPSDTIVHRLDPRGKIIFQSAFALAVFVQSEPRWLLLFGAIAVVCLYLARCSVLATLRGFWFPLLILSLAPLFAMISFRPLAIDPQSALEPAKAGVRVIFVLFVSAAYIRTTPLRESRAAIQRLIPGRIGTFIGVGFGLVVRLFPAIRRDIQTLRKAEAARLGTERSIIKRAQTLGVGGLQAAMDRSDQLSRALQARCFAWNPTLPELTFACRDYVVIAASFLLVLTVIV
ncbi:energy-coupling factor transporter transmembrane protein EcfT [Salinarchaeum sp. IM2453]|uniref:energy-coupling factor transporter transmembrane component T family protein n=1 Tax=Salinarchaeum sp. IM2453 TaxID=2862870 RepID=UPI001C83B080|nr:energy-coupling factor transporter transmembrane component T [Salinarchaeum sp. IM2453]QZA89640.1 energy-coupling factor transporter transmembrane protein EcfT [Salinarchaeum sp. IM2453]